MVYELSRVANRRHNGAIPENVFTKPPSAELRPDQKDTDSLPDYDVLDAILEAYVERYRTPRADRRRAQRCRSSWCATSSTKWIATNTSASRPRPA